MKDGTAIVIDQISFPRVVNGFGCGNFASFGTAEPPVRSSVLNRSRQTKGFILGILLIIFLCPHRIFAQSPCTITVNGDQPTVAAAVAAAADGSVICLNAGTWDWDDAVDLSRGATVGMEIRGAGSYVSPWGSAGETIVHARNSGLIFSGYEAPNNSVVIDNIRFTVDTASVGVTTNPFAIITWNSGNPGANKPWIVHHNDFFVTDRCDGPKFIQTGAHGGLIYRNKFVAGLVAADPCNNTDTNINVVQHVITDDGSWWASKSTMGSADTTGLNNLYVETNYFNGFNVASDADTSSRMVWRFNEMHNASLSGHGYDSSTQGERHVEIYNNTFLCDGTINLNSWIAKRGGTGMIFNNIFPAFDPSFCDFSADGGDPILLALFRVQQCEAEAGVPGLYPDNYPIIHQEGWGFINGSNQTVGPSQGWPAFQQALEPMYVFNNVNNTGQPSLVVRRTGYIGECRAMAYSSSGKTMGNTLTATGYVSAGQHAFVAFADLVGGTPPSVSDNLGNLWTPVQGGTNGSTRLSGWQAHITTGGLMTVTIAFDSSSAARAGTLVTMRQLTASPVDQNPPVIAAKASPYNGPPSGTLSQSDEVVLGYFALNGPTSQAGNSFTNDAINATFPDLRAVSTGYSPGGVGINGTTGDGDTNNVSVAVTYRYVSSTSPIQPQITDSTANRNGLAGTISFKNNGTNPDLQVTDFIQPNREYYDQAANFDGTSGTGSGPRSSRPATCITGVGYWATDQGNWNQSGSGVQGVFDKCTATNTWTDTWYTPYPYPHPLTISGAIAPTITTAPSSQGIAVGTSATLTVVATGSAPLSYQWYQGQGGDTSTPVGANSSTFTTPALTASTSYWVQVANPVSSANSPTAAITVTAPVSPAITTQPAAQTITSGTTATLSVVASGTGPFAYQWYQGASGDTSKPGGTNSSSFTTPALTTTTSYWVSVTNTTGTVNSATATITVNAPVSATGSGNPPTPPVTGQDAVPAVTFTQPANNGRVTGSITVSADASSTLGIAGVQFQLDHTNLGPEVTTAPYSLTWDTTNARNGTHTLTAVARDTSGQLGSASIRVRVGDLSRRQTFNLPATGGISVSTAGNAGGTGVQVDHGIVTQEAAGTPAASVSQNADGTPAAASAGARAIVGQADSVAAPRSISTTPSVRALGGVAIIGYRPNGVLVTQAGVPASPQITSGRVYAEISSTVNTGIALSNITANTATVNFYFTDGTGKDFGSDLMTLPPYNQISVFLNEAPFNGPSGFLGTFTFNSDTPIGASALRGLTNERNEFLFTTLSVAPVGVSPDANTLAQFVDGAGWTTTVLLTNASDSLETGTIQFFGQGSGSEKTAPLNITANGVVGTTFNYSIPAHSSSRFDTSGTGASVQVGSVQITPGAAFTGGSNDVPAAISLFQLRENGITISQTSVTAAPLGTAFQLYVEALGVNGQPGSVQSGVAIANPSSSPAVVYADLIHLNGSPSGLATATINLPPDGEVSKFINEFFPAMPASFQGLVNLTASSPIAVTALRANYNERDDFLMTTTPPLNYASASSGGLSFPQVVNGGGFSTQIVVFGQNAGSGQLELMSSSAGTQTGATTTGSPNQ